MLSGAPMATIWVSGARSTFFQAKYLNGKQPFAE